MERRTLPQWNVEYHHTHFQPVAMRTSFEIVEPGQSHSLRPDCSGVCRSVERLKNLMASNSWICTVGLKMNWAALQKCIFQHGVNARTPQNSQTSFSEDLFVGIYAAFTVFLVVFYCGNKAAKKNAPTNFKTCWSRCYTNQLHWFLHKLRKKCAPVFTQALQKLVFTPTIPCTQTSFCTI
jgi:hypothetical protein